MKAMLFASRCSVMCAPMTQAQRASVSTKSSIAHELDTLAGVDVVLASAGIAGRRGHPIPAIVAVAHRSGRRVAAHIETGADVRVAVAAGVDIVAHLPGFALTSAEDSARAVIAPDDAQRAVQRGAAVTPTAWLATQRRISRGNTAQIARTIRVQRQHIATLLCFGGRLGNRAGCTQMP